MVDLVLKRYLYFIAGLCRSRAEIELHFRTAHISRFYHLHMPAVMVVWEALAAIVMVLYLEAAMEAMVMPTVGLHFTLLLVHRQ